MLVARQGWVLVARQAGVGDRCWSPGRGGTGAGHQAGVGLVLVTGQGWDRCWSPGRMGEVLVARPGVTGTSCQAGVG